MTTTRTLTAQLRRAGRRLLTAIEVATADQELVPALRSYPVDRAA